MNNKFLYRSSLKSKDVPKYQIMGITSELILSKEIFVKNSDISTFLKSVFHLEYKEYVMRSRTLILSRTVRTIEKCSDVEYQEYRKKLLNFVEEYYTDEFKNRNTSKSVTSRWVTGD